MQQECDFQITIIWQQTFPEDAVTHGELAICFLMKSERFIKQLLLPIRTWFTEKKIQNLSKELENVITMIKPPVIIILEKSLT